MPPGAATFRGARCTKANVTPKIFPEQSNTSNKTRAASDKEIALLRIQKRRRIRMKTAPGGAAAIPIAVAAALVVLGPAAGSARADQKADALAPAGRRHDQGDQNHER
jgi:hypothetical protein